MHFNLALFSFVTAATSVLADTWPFLITGLTTHPVKGKTGHFTYTFSWADLGPSQAIGTGNGSSVDPKSTNYTTLHANQFLYAGSSGWADVPSIKITHYFEGPSQEPFSSAQDGYFVVYVKNYINNYYSSPNLNYVGLSNQTIGAEAPIDSYPLLQYPPFTIDLKTDGTTTPYSQ